jgi:GH15 family glucan-1,4-alpha-glucosidase
MEIAAGARRTLVLTPRPAKESVMDQALRLHAITQAFWREWIGYCRYRGPYAPAVTRSALALKLLTYAPTGAIVAAPTTSLPEALGGTRNWDYRYCWLRDSAFTLYALAVLGYSGEARHFVQFLVRACAASHPDLQIMYGINAEPELDEQTLDHLDGYFGSRPVRIGNGAYRQRQIDVYGEVLDSAMVYRTLGGRLDGAVRGMLEETAEFVAAHWREPDQGLWEMRGPPQHYTHSKAMSWVALDRACRLLGTRPHWQTARDGILDDIAARALAPDSGHLVQAYGHPGVDAALLLLPLVALPIDRRTLEATVIAVERELRHGPFVYRYKNEDGLEGTEGAFFICSFWLVDALLLCGRHDEAKALFEQLLATANDVGLYAEEIERESGAFLGNFPQAFTHLALIGAAAHLDLYEKGGMDALVGSHADRARRQVTATFGWRALWAALKATRRVGRIFPSRRSILKNAMAGARKR